LRARIPAQRSWISSEQGEALPFWIKANQLLDQAMLAEIPKHVCAWAYPRKVLY